MESVNSIDVLEKRRKKDIAFNKQFERTQGLMQVDKPFSCNLWQMLDRDNEGYYQYQIVLNEDIEM